MLEASGRAAGPWPHCCDSLTLFSPARYSSLAGTPFPGADGDRSPHHDEAVACFTSYAGRLDPGFPRAVAPGVRRTGDVFAEELESGGRLSARAVTAAPGTFGRPHRPTLPDLEECAGKVLHAADHCSPTPSTGRRVMDGAGDFAVQITAGTVRVTPPPVNR
ncbi:hypothetical protein [Streptomyces pimonensis]|uniref:hypothetical protein n=1 Tax=Streptomyces pimonensis TaxID=2860288 RepID=UPI0035285109